MTTPLIIGLVALLLFILIGYNVVQQYKDKLAAERRVIAAKQKAIVSEVDELLANTANINFSKTLLIILQQRVKNALTMMLNNSPKDTSIAEHLKDTSAQLKATSENYQSPPEDVFNVPNSDKETLEMLQAIKKIRAIIGSEHNKGKIKTDLFVAENYRMEIIQLKIHLHHGITKIIEANALQQVKIASDMIVKLLKSLAPVKKPDKYLTAKKNQLLQMQNDIKMKATTNAESQIKQSSKPEKKDALTVDNIFQNKKKW